MKKLLTFTTWIIVRLFPFPKNHAWHNNKFGLNEWAERSTQLNNDFSFMFWFIIFFVIANILS